MSETHAKTDNNFREFIKNQKENEKMSDKAASKKVKKLWKASAKKQGISLRKFTSGLLKQDDKLVERWYANKDGDCNQDRSNANKTRASLERQATRTAKRKKKVVAPTE